MSPTFPQKVNIHYIVSMHGSCYNRMIGTNKKRIASLRFYHLLVEMRGVEPLSKKPVP